MSNDEQLAMTLQDEIEHLSKRRVELKTISCNLQDILDWFKKHHLQLESTVFYTGLEFAITEIDDLVSDLAGEIYDLEEQVDK